jgi:hypothetical protein
MEIKIEDKDLPGLYQASNRCSIREQNKYFYGIGCYLFLLISAALFTFISDGQCNAIYKVVSTLLFLSTLLIMIWLRTQKPDNIWYNGRAVAESVKTRSWRWMMRAEPYLDFEDIEKVRKHFINDLKIILKENESLIKKLGSNASIDDPVSNKMSSVRNLSLNDRFEVYKKERIGIEAKWYKKKSMFNKRRATFWFNTTVGLHSLAIILLLYNIKDPALKLPITVIAVCASSVLTWLQAKKHNELSSSYTLTVHEIILIGAESTNFESEVEFSNYIMNCENAFSKEHTQWFARKSE